MTVAAGSPAWATTGTVTVPDSVYYDFGCIDVPYTYAYMLRPGYELENAHLEVTGPDGLEVGRDSITSSAVSGTSEVQVCSGEPGAYAGTVEVLACTPNITDCYEFVVNTSFSMRDPYTRTGLVAKPKRADRGDRVKFVMTVRDERPAGYFPTGGETVRLQQYRSGAWRSVKGGAVYLDTGRAVAKVTMRENRGRFRAVMRTTSLLNGSVSRTITIR